MGSLRVSVQATTWVWERSESGGNARLVLLAIADAADADGDNAWPTQERMARMAKVSVRTVRRLVLELIMLGELEVEEHAGGTVHTRDDRRPHLYRLPKMLTGGHTRPPVKKSDKRPTGGHGATNGRTKRGERPDTGVPITSFSLNTQKESNPSGGATAPAAPPSLEVSSAPTEEDPVAQPADNLTLFDTPAPKKARKPKPPASPSAGTVVAKFVDSYRLHHGKEDPLKSDILRVGRDAKAILGNGEAGPEELEQAAAEMGKGIFANLGVALKKLREAKRPPAQGARQGMAPASPHTSPYWQEARERKDREWYQTLLTDDDVVAWVREDPVVVEDLCVRWPELASRLRGAA